MTLVFILQRGTELMTFVPLEQPLTHLTNVSIFQPAQTSGISHFHLTKVLASQNYKKN